MRPITQILLKIKAYNDALPPDAKPTERIVPTRTAVQKGAARLGHALEGAFLASQRAKDERCARVRRLLKAEGRSPLEVQACLIDLGLIADTRLPSTPRIDASAFLAR